MVLKFFLKDGSIFCISILIHCSSGIKSEVVVVICDCACIIDIIFEVNKLVSKVISCFCPFFLKKSVLS